MAWPESIEIKGRPDDNHKKATTGDRQAIGMLAVVGLQDK